MDVCHYVAGFFGVVSHPNVLMVQGRIGDETVLCGRAQFLALLLSPKIQTFKSAATRAGFPVQGPPPMVGLPLRYTIPMQEYVANAIVLRKDPLRDLDGRYALFTDRFGKVIGKTTSSRKIASKLAPHLEPGMVTRVRYIEQKGTQIVDALKVGRLAVPILDLHLLAELLPEGQSETDIWRSLLQNDFSWGATLRILGWDPEGARCVSCGRANARAFFIRRQEFFCEPCASKLGRDGVLLVA